MWCGGRLTAVDYDKEEKGGRIGEDWDDLKGVEFYIVPDNSVEEEATDDSKYYSTPPAAVTVNQGEELCPSAQSNTICTFPKPTTPTSSPPVVEIASESAPAVEAQPTMTLQVSGPSPQHAQDATVETTEGLTFTYDFSLFQDRSWLALTVEEASNALSSTPPSHPHYAANLFILSQLLLLRYTHKDYTNLNQALQHAESSLRLFPSFLRLIPLMSICRILSLQGNQARADFVQSEGLAIHTEGKRVFTLMSSSRLHEERSSSTQEAEHLETAITYMTNELATQSGKERSLLLLFLSCMHNYRFIATQEAVDLDMAIEYLAEMTGINADPKHQRILARYYVARYDISKDLTDLEAATAAIEATLSHAKESTVCSDVALRAEVAHQKWLHTDWKYHVRAAINWSMAVVEYLDNEEDILSVYVKLGAQLRGYSRITGDRRGLMHAKDLASKMVRRLPEGHELQGVMAEELASLESMLAGDYGKDPVAHLEAGLEAIDPEEDPELYLDRLMVLSENLMKRFDRHGNPADITAALEKLEIVVAATEHIGWRHVVNLDALSCYLLRRFNALGDLADLDNAVMYGEMCLTAAAAAPESDGIHRNVIPVLQFHLCSTYFERTKYNTELTDLDKALKLATAASRGIDEGHPLYISRLTHIGGLYLQRFARSCVRKDIDTAIAIGQQALQAALRIDGDGCDTNQLAMVKGNISELYRSRYLVFKSDEEDMTDGIHHGEEALRLTPSDHPSYAGRLILVGNWLHERYLQNTGNNIEDIDRAIEYLKTAIQMSSNRYQVQMAKSFLFEMETHRRGSDLTNIAPLNAEIEARLKAVAALPPGQSVGAAAMKTWLAVQYRVRYERIGDLADIEKAVEYSYAALSDFPGPEGRRGAILSELSAHLMSRYKRLGAMEDLDMSISIARESVKCTPIESHRRHDRLIELCQHLIDRFHRNPVSSYDDLLAAITLGQLCVDATVGRDGPVHFQIILADALHLRHLAIPVFIQDLHRAIILTLNALMDPRGTGHIPTKDISYRLGHLYHSRFRCTQQIDDIDLAIEYLEHTLRRLHKDEPARGKTLDLLGRCYLMRYQAKQNTGPDGQRSFHSFREAWNTLSAPPILRINGAQRVGDVYARSGRWADAVVMYEGCVNLMPQISRPFLSRSDQQRLLATLAGITSRAATGALIAGKGATHALKLLELGRGIIAGFIIDCRSDMTNSRSDHPELCREFAALRKEIEDGLSTPVRPTGWEILGPESVMAWRKKVMARMEEVLRTIRALPGYEEFLRPPSGKSLMELAVSGPLVVVNADFFGCDAIIITSTAIKSITLEKCDWGTARELLGGMKDLVTGGISTYADRTKKTQALLIWLWDVIVSPILTALGITAAPPRPLGELPHIWWMGTGPLGLAPFHAAGHHTNGSTENTISRVISSYTPNLKALQYSRQKPAETIRDLLLVAMPTTDDESELEGVEEELTEIIGIVQPDVTTNIMVQPGVPEVLSSLGNYQAVHFACHGVTEADDPSSGGLLLQGGRLTVADIAAKSGCAMMAYLSACSTAETGDSNLVDEGITLASAFQMAGFRHVVATMWEGRDEMCTAVAESFYESVVKKGCGVAKALHDAVVEARGEGRQTGKVLDWAPFIHNGA